MKRSNQKRGFTIVEMVIVIAIVAVLAAVLIPTYSNIVKKANNSAYEQEKTNQQLIDATEEIERLQAENKSLEDIQKEYGSWDNIEAVIKSALAGQTVDSGTQNITIKVPESNNSGNYVAATKPEEISAAVKTAVEKAMEKISTGGSGLTAEQLEMIVKNVVENSTNVTEGDVTYVNNSYYTTETKEAIEVGSLIGQMNNVLVKKGADKVVTPSDAEELLLANGFNISTLNVTVDGKYRVAFDSKLHRFCFVYNEGGTIKSTSADTFEKDDLFVFVQNDTDLTTYAECSVYLTENYSAETFTTSKSVDTGKSGVKQVIYKNNSTSEQNAIIRTNGCDVVIDAPYATVKHYGSAMFVEIKAVSANSYYEYGQVGLVDIANGRLVITDAEEASVEQVFLSATENEFDNIILAVMNDAEVPKKVQCQDVEANTDLLIATIQQVDSEGTSTAAEEEIYLYADGNAYEKTKHYTNVSDMGETLLVAINDTVADDSNAKDFQNKEIVADKNGVKEEVKQKYNLNFAAKTSALGLGESFKFVVNQNGVVWELECKEEDAGYITLTQDGVLTSMTFDTTCTVKATVGEQTIQQQVELNIMHGGSGTEEDPAEISNKYQWEYAWYATYYDNMYVFELVNDIDFGGEDPKGYAYSNTVIHGNNHKLMNANGCLFSQQSYLYNLTIDNLTLQNCVSNYSLFCKYGSYNVTTKQEFINVDAVNCTAKGGALYLPWVYDNYTVLFKDCDVTNCIVNNDVTAQGFVAGFVGNSKATVTLDNCTLQATLSSSNPAVAALIGTDGTIKNCAVLPGTTIIQRGTRAASAVTGSATIQNTTCYATIIKSTESDVNKNGYTNTVAYSSSALGFGAESFALNADGSVDYSGSASISTLKVSQVVTTDRLRNGEFENGGFPTDIAAKKEFTNVTAGKLTNAVDYITSVKNVTTELTNKLYCTTSALPAGVEFNQYGFAFANGVLYLNAEQGGQYTSNYFSGTLKSGANVNAIKVTVYYSAYDASGNLLGTVAGSYNVTLNK